MEPPERWQQYNELMRALPPANLAHINQMALSTAAARSLAAAAAPRSTAVARVIRRRA